MLYNYGFCGCVASARKITFKSRPYFCLVNERQITKRNVQPLNMHNMNIKCLIENSA